MRSQGKTRFVGVSTHKNEAEVIQAVVDDPEKFFDTVLVAYNFGSDPGVKEAIALAAKANIGVIAMKTQAGGYNTKELGDISPHQAALKWVLQDPNVHTTIPSMINLDQVREDTAVMGMKLTRADLDILNTYAMAIKSHYCHQCGACEATCPKGVDIPTINRCLMYAEGYGDLELARSTYTSELVGPVSAAVCGECDHCVARCARGLDIPIRMRRAQTLFA
jgi:predicted aldo/keto reductase-like oxidoreductase